MKESERFTHSLKPIIKLKPDKKCRLKDHWSGVCKQVAGYLDYMAALDETGERFVFAGVPKITSHTKKLKDKSKNFKDKPKYSQRAVEAAMHRLRADKVISGEERDQRGRLVSYRERDGIMWEGYLVAAHDSMTSIIDGHCCWHNFKPHSKAKNAVPNAVSSAVQSAVPSAVESAVSSAVESAVPSAVNVSAQSPEPKCDNLHNRPLAFQPLRDTKTAATVPSQSNPETGAAKNGNGRSGLAVASSSQSFTAEEEKLWEEMINHDDFPEIMAGAKPRQDKGEKQKVLEQLKTHGVDVMVEAISTWAENREMDLATRITRWRAWLEEGGPFVKRAAENA